MHDRLAPLINCHSRQLLPQVISPKPINSQVSGYKPVTADVIPESLPTAVDLYLTESDYILLPQTHTVHIQFLDLSQPWSQLFPLCSQ